MFGICRRAGRRLPPLAASAPILPVTAQPEVSGLPDNVADLLLQTCSPWLRYPARFGAPPQNSGKRRRFGKSFPRPSRLSYATSASTPANLNAPETRLRDAVDANTIGKPESRHDWFIRDDRTTWLMALLNSSLSKHLWLQHIKQDGKGVSSSLLAKTTPNGSGKWEGGLGRLLPRRKTRHADQFWVHHAARIKFKQVGEKLFCRLNHFIFLPVMAV